MASLIDDIYTAATEGDVVRLRYLLSMDGGKELLKEQLVYNEVGEWKTSEYTVVFSILDNMRGKVNYDVLDVLAEHGVSFQETVTLKGDERTMERPLLEFAICQWQDPVLAEYMLKKGVSPDVVDKQTFINGKTSCLTMLYYAIVTETGTQMTELLLKYGADPEKCCEVFNFELDVYQYIPPLYYSLVEKSDYQKTVCLFRYGANPQCGIDVGAGFMHNTNFKKYVMLNHPHLSKYLVQTFEEAQKAPASPKTAPVKTKPAETVMSAQVVKERSESGTLGHKLNSGSQVTSLRRCYGKTTAYSFANFGFLALGFCVIGPLIALNSKEPGVAGGMLIFGIPCALIAAAIFASVQKKAKKRGQDGVMLQFVGDSVLMFVRGLLMMTIILIPIVKAIGSDIQWEERKTAFGGNVMVKRTGEGTYEDALGNQYVDADD